MITKREKEFINKKKKNKRAVYTKKNKNKEKG